MKKFALAAASAMLAMTVAFAFHTRPAYAGAKVDCDAVMNELDSGKHEKEFAKDLNTTLYQVHKCKRHAKEAAKAETKVVDSGQEGKRSASRTFAGDGCPFARDDGSRGGTFSVGIVP